MSRPAHQQPPPDRVAGAAPRLRRRHRAAAVTATVAAHALIVLALMRSHPDPPRTPESEAVQVSLLPTFRPILPPRPPPEAPTTPAAAPGAAQPAARSVRASSPKPPPAPRPAAVDAPTLPASRVETTEVAFGLSDAQLAGAITAGSGAGGGGGGGGGQACDMVRRLQAALRRDPEVRAAVAQASGAGRGVIKWNGDWVRSPGQDGKGLAGVRQAIIMEVAFAPEACRAEPVRGLVLISLGDSPGTGRLALGSGVWRWSDLLFARGASRP